MINKIQPRTHECIPTAFISQMVDILIRMSDEYPVNSMTAQIMLLRAEHYADVVEAYRKSLEPQTGPDPRD